MELHQRRVRLSVRKRFLTREWSDTETGSSEQGSWHRAAGVQEAFGQCSQTQVLNFGWSCHLVRSIPSFVSIVFRDKVAT
mgnify:CR=1 FL=1